MTTGLQNLKHIVVVMMDNRSFDHMLGSLKAEDPRIDHDTQRVTAPVAGGANELTTVVNLLGEQSITYDDIGLRRPTLDEVFLKLTGQPAESAADAA